MSFAAPLFLAAALAAIIPVVLHMINRQKAKDLPFSTLRFLRISAQKTRRRKQIHDAFLMLVRAAVLLLIALGLSKPAMTNLRTLFSGASTAVAIVLDNSASMGAVDNNTVRFQVALSAANQIVDQLHDGDQLALFLTGGRQYPELGKLDRSHDKVRQILGQLREASYQRGDVAAKVLEARKLVAKSELPNKQVFVITDLQQNGWDSLKQIKEDKQQESKSPAGDAQAPKQAAAQDADSKANDEIPIVVVDLHRSPKPNVAVQHVEVEAAVPVAGVPIKASVDLLNASSAPQPRTVELYVDGNREATSAPLTVPAESNLRYDFIFAFKSGGLHRGDVRLVGEDGSRLDDRFYFTMEVDQGIPVAVVKPARHEIGYLEDTFYLEKALSGAGKGGNWALQVTPLLREQLEGEPLGGYKVVFLVNLPALDETIAEKLRTYVEQGGNLIWFCGDNVVPDEYNQMDQQAKHGLLPLPLLDVRSPTVGETRDSWHIAFLDKKHRALNQLLEPASLYQSVLIYKFVRMDPGKAGEASILARLDDGEPLVAQRRIERGSVTLFGTSSHVGWTNLPIRKIFLPLMVRMTFELSGAEQALRQGVAGAPLVLSFEHEIRPPEMEVVPPSGETLRLKTQEDPTAKVQAFRFLDTQDIGIYTLRPMQVASPKPIGYAVNVDPEESSALTVKHEDLQDLFGTEPVVFAEDPEDLTSTFAALKQGKSLWGLFLTLVLIFLVFETFVSNRLSPKRQDEDAELAKLPPGMRRLAKLGRTEAAAASAAGTP